MEIPPEERISYHNLDPADIVAARDEAGELVAALLARVREPWMDHAACRESDTRVFFARNTARALQVCGRCPVLFACREYAIGSEVIVDGVFGGLDAQALRQARKVRALSRAHSYRQRCSCDECKAHRAGVMRSWRRRTGRTGPS